MTPIAQEHSLFEIDRELDTLLDEIEEEIENRGEASADLLGRFQQCWSSVCRSAQGECRGTRQA